MTSGGAHKYKVLVADAVDQAGIDILKSIAEVDVKTKQPEDALIQMIGDYDAMMVRSATTVTAKIIEAGKKLKIIARAGVGVDNVDIKAATERGVFVVNSPSGNTIAAAEHTLAMMFASARLIPAADASVRGHKWERASFMGRQLNGKVLGIVGLGQVGGHVAKVAREVGMRLVGYDPYVNEARAASMHVELLPLEDLLKEVDFLTLHIPLIPATKHLLNAEKLAMMKPTARIINCARGGVIDESALSDALKAGKLGGAALDVFEVEKAFPEDHPLLHCPNIVLTPHLGASTVEAQVNVAVDVAQQIRDCLLGHLPDSAVNIPGLRASELADMKELLDLASIMGQIASQTLIGAIEKVTCTLEGDYAAVTSHPLMLAATKGALSPNSAVPINFVNVSQIAERNRILMSVAKESQRQKPRIRVKVSSHEHSSEMAGTLTDDGEFLMVAFMGVPIYMPIQRKKGDAYYVYSKHDDKPGLLAKLTTVLGDAGYNIGNMHLGRTVEVRPLGIAIASLDKECEAPLLEKIKKVMGENLLETNSFSI